jgi:predicted GNAT superfamily acetyltransferase
LNRPSLKNHTLTTALDYLDADRLQRKVWHFPDREIVPLNELVVLQKHGGHVFGAFDRGRMVAFCFGCPGYREGKLYHYSRMLGVLPGLQDSGIGYTLKLKQREYVLKQGLDLIVWTFDPLQSRNAYLNIEKLGCVIGEYSENLYPESGSRFNRGLESDRFTPEWWIASRRVKERLAGRRPPHDVDRYAVALETRIHKEGWREPVAVRTKLKDRHIGIEIPDDIDAIKRKNLRLAQHWRSRTREALQAYLRHGYVIMGFASTPGPGRRRSFYLLEKGFKFR